MSNRLNTVHDHHHEEELIEDSFEGIQWKKPHFYDGGNLFIPIIYESENLSEDIPSGFNAVKITIDGRVKSSLDWTKEKERAKELVEKGFKIYWDINLGLFNELKYPLEHSQQFLSLELSIKHFMESIWSSFKENSLGLCLYKGSVEFAGNASEIAMDYFNLLTREIASEVECFIQVDATDLSSSTAILHLLNRDQCAHLHVIVKNTNVETSEITWETNASPFGYIGGSVLQVADYKDVVVAVCLSTSTEAYQELDKPIQHLHSQGINYKIIPEQFLTSEWQGLDFLIVVSSSVSPLTKRKLLGFCAAGGSIVTIGDFLGVPQEISFQEWSKIL